jgi:two-component system CheB/CheR fusion protein
MMLMEHIADLDRLAGCRILVVDDNTDAADSVALMLQLYGAEVEVAYDGPTAVASARSFKPGVILLDIGMPGMDGHEAARIIRQDAGAHTPYLIALTGWSQQEDREQSLDAGFDLHLVKPVEVTALLEALDKCHEPSTVPSS